MTKTNPYLSNVDFNILRDDNGIWAGIFTQNPSEISLERPKTPFNPSLRSIRTSLSCMLHTIIPAHSMVSLHPHSMSANP